jgi:tetratricopeptide (TPR) repeat protein
VLTPSPSLRGLPSLNCLVRLHRPAQPKAAQYLLRQSAFVDTTNSDGHTPLQVAEAHRWKEMQRVLRDPSLLFWNRAARANKLYKANDFEPACEGYALAQAEMERMRTPPSVDNIATFHFNYARSSQGLGRYTQAIDLFSRVLAVNDEHTRALEHRVECFRALFDHDAALADLETLTQAHWEGADGATRSGWRAKQAEIQAELNRSARDVLGVDARAGEAEVKKAYRALCLAWHPDKHAAASEDTQARAKHRFSRIQAAYEKVHRSFGQGGFGQAGYGQGTRRSSWSDTWSGYE